MERATFAWLCDVFVLPEFRGLGLSKWLVKRMLAHPNLQNLRRHLLATFDAHTLYQHFGYEPLARNQAPQPVRVSGAVGEGGVINFTV
ncbi:GNAT family N-acetyltransferase [Hymenobacter arizonensis]|uniref:GNAT family N-acetyltransferase n=1 Tax=Hymenobacter arizonensis TaxID=1227077 RepID=UPI000A54133C|nr:GNAT family N-acetyltransferase [Hymenobacter arizonensis]